jgi:hypothetical protein
MSEESTKVDAYYALKPAKYGLLKEFNISQCVDSGEWTGLRLTVVLYSPRETDKRLLRLDFSGVKTLKLGEIYLLLWYVVDIRSISEHQLEDLNYSVAEDEHSLFSFVCADFSVTVE